MPFQFRQAHLVLASLITGATLANAQVQTVYLRPVADTTLIQTEPNNNMGAVSFFNSGTTGISTRNRGLVQFDFTSAIPQNALIQSASVELEVVLAPQNEVEFSLFGLHRVLAPWGEGDKLPENPNTPGFGAPATLNEATWNHRFAGTSETWSTPGGAAGTDYVSIASTVEFIEAEGNYLFDTNPRMVDDVQGWLADPSSNNGWMLIAFSEDLRYTARRFGSSENPDFAPLLTVTFQVVPEPSTTLIILCALAAFALCKRRGIFEF